VNDRGPIPWEDSVRMAVTTIITEYIQRNTIDYLSAPRRRLEAPRHEFTQYVLKNARVQRIGAEILWVDVGHFHILDDNVEKTRVDAWAVEQQGIVEQKLARSEADKEIMRELGRAEGQIEIIRSITLALQEAQIPVTERVNIHRIFLTRVAHILKALESRQSLPTTENPPSENKPEKP